MDTGIIIILSILVVISIIWVFYVPASEKEYKRKLNERLQEEYIYDPETGSKLTLEQAEKGHWINHDNEFNVMLESEIEKLLTEESKTFNRALNHFKGLKTYRKHLLEEDEVEFLEKTYTLSKYDNWTYSNCFKIEYCNGLVFLPCVLLKGSRTPYYSIPDYNEPQLLYWIKLEKELGHYYFSEKSTFTKIMESVKSSSNLVLKNYQTITFKKTTNQLFCQNLLSEFSENFGLEIEFFNTSILIKTRVLVNPTDIKRIERIIKNIC
jgi:hypothetical protein